MNKIILIAIIIFTLPLHAQKNSKKVTVDKYDTQLTTLIAASSDFLTANKLTSAQAKQMIDNTFRAIAEQPDFVKATTSYFPAQYSKDLTEILKPYYQGLTIQQIDSLIAINANTDITNTQQLLTLCNDANHINQKLDEMLQATVTAKNDKAKAKAIKKIKKNISSYRSDCTDHYRQTLATLTSLGTLAPFGTLAPLGTLSEPHINAIYHTIPLTQLQTYTYTITCPAYQAHQASQKAITDDIYNIQSAIVSHFQTWTYKAYPTLFTKKQVQPSKRKGRKTKKTGKQPVSDTIIEGVPMY